MSSPTLSTATRPRRTVTVRRVALAGLGVVTALLAVVALAYRVDINRQYGRVQGKTSLVPSPYGDIEYREGGVGPDVLVVHGSGGGYDQGELIAQAVLGDQFHWIAPSRFGYLRSTFHAGATFDDQARAYAALLDHLGIQRVAVVAMSQGGPSALLFALLYPDRVSSLTLISCGVTPLAGEDQGQANQKGTTLVTAFQHDELYWLVTHLFNKQFMTLMGADEVVVAGLTPQQLELVRLTIDDMNPASLRSAGVVFDNTRPKPGARIAGIQAPTLVIHATDDTLQLYENGAFAAATIPGARLLRFERGGHLLIFVEQAAVRAAIQAHIRQHVEGVVTEAD